MRISQYFDDGSMRPQLSLGKRAYLFAWKQHALVLDLGIAPSPRVWGLCSVDYCFLYGCLSAEVEKLRRFLFFFSWTTTSFPFPPPDGGEMGKHVQWPTWTAKLWLEKHWWGKVHFFDIIQAKLNQQRKKKTSNMQREVGKKCFVDKSFPCNFYEKIVINAIF